MTALQLNGSTYETRVIDGRTEIKANGQWMLHGAFVDWLSATDKHQELFELWKKTMNKTNKTKQ